MKLSVRALLSKQTSVRHNFSANLISNVLSAVVSFACVPIYVRVLGVTGYGVIGVWTTLETLASLLDLGLSPTMSRELAASNRQPERWQEVRDLVRTLEFAYWGLGLLIGAAIVLSASLIAAYWLQSNQLPPGEVRTSVAFMGVLIFCRWPLSFYSGGLTGLERQVLLSWIAIAFVLIRSVGAVFVLIFVSPTLFAFFLWQIAVNLTLTATVAVLVWWCMPPGQTPAFRAKTVRRIWRFAGGVTAIALVSALLSALQLVVSGLLPLEDFGYYSLGSRVSGVLLMFSSPVFAALFPAFVRIAAVPDETKLAELYHRASQIMSLLILPAAITIVFFARPLIFAWTGDELIADHTALIVALLTAGIAFHCVGMIPYALQLAHGWTSLAFRTGLAYVPVTALLLFVLTKHYGAAGAAAVWAMFNVSNLATVVPLMHRRLLRSEARRWYFQDIGIPLVACLVTASLIATTAGTAATRTGAALTVIVAGVIVGFVGLLATPLVRTQLRIFLTKV